MDSVLWAEVRVGADDRARAQKLQYHEGQSMWHHGSVLKCMGHWGSDWEI